MGRLLLAISLFFRIFFSAELAGQVRELLQARAAGELPPGEPSERPATARKADRPPARSEGLTLLAALQREARFVDFVMERLDDYSDAQIGAAARELHRGCAQLIERMFGVQPLLTASEGDTVELDEYFDAEQVRLTGNIAGQPPYHGQLMHHGWVATRCELPTWTGSQQAGLVVAPAEVEIK